MELDFTDIDLSKEFTVVVTVNGTNHTYSVDDTYGLSEDVYYYGFSNLVGYKSYRYNSYSFVDNDYTTPKLFYYNNNLGIFCPKGTTLITINGDSRVILSTEDSLLYNLVLLYDPATNHPNTNHQYVVHHHNYQCMKYAISDEEFECSDLDPQIVGYNNYVDPSGNLYYMGG